MSNTNLIFFGYDSQLASKLIDITLSYFTKVEKINFSRKTLNFTVNQEDINDELEEDIIVHETEEPQVFRLIDITSKKSESKLNIFENYINSKDNNIFICTFNTDYRLKEQDEISLKNIYTSFGTVSLNNFFCIIDRSKLKDDEDLNIYDSYIRSKLGFIFNNKQNSFDFYKYQKRVFFDDVENTSKICQEESMESSFFGVFTELKNCWEEIGGKENQEEDTISSVPKEELELVEKIPMKEKNEGFIASPLNQLSSLIDKIIRQRKEQSDIINRYINNIKYVDGAIQELRDALDNLLRHPQVTEELKSRLQEFKSASIFWDKEIVSALERLENVKNRLAREAVTIGCSGQARVGKSTLLQTIGNLPEEAIPTGKGIPVTAVRSRLRHSQERKAILSLRDKNTFLDELVKPFHRELNLSVVNSFEDFRNFNYNSDELATDENVELLGRLKQMQAALSSYGKHLTGRTKIIEDLTQIRPWVAYPKQEEEKDPNCSRLYLAVKNIEIQCSFLLDVEKLILVDLPGLGEVNVDAEEHHVQGLKNEVDLVLLILRPTAQSSYWGNKDRKALNLISQAVEGISKLGDFVIIVVNTGDGDDKELYKILINDIHKQLNESKADSRYRVLTCNAIDPTNVKKQVLEPVLEHLINRLPVMDREIIDSSFTQWQRTVEKISIDIDGLETSLKIFPSQFASMEGNIYQKAKVLREKLAVELGNAIRKLQDEIQAEKDEESIIDKELIKAIDEKHEAIQKWARNGLGKGKQEWYEKARGRFDIDKTVNAFAIEEINRARTCITDTYSQLDLYFETKIELLWRQISNIISACTGNLIRDTAAGKEALEKLIFLLGAKGIGDPFPSLREATEYLLKCGEENAIFQSHLLPRLIEETQKLVPERLNLTNISYEVEDAEKIILDIISRRIIQTSYEVQKILKAKPFVSNILYSAAVKFEDSLVRSTDADRQFFDFALFYTNEIWTNEFKAIENNHAIVKRADNAVTKIKELLNNFS